MKNRLGRIGLVLGCLVSILGSAAPARALDRLCDPAHEDCRQVLIDYIRAETVGIDVGFWFMEDARYTAALIARFNAGVPVRVLMDLRANATNQFNAQRLAELQAAGIPMRRRTASGIMHYKLMLFAGQGIVEFSGANFSADAWKYTTPYVNYVDESAYFTDNPSFVHSFMTKYDDLWTDVTSYTNYVNVNGALTRNYPTFPEDPQLNFPPLESYANRAVGRYNQEQQKIDVIMYRITDRRHTDAMIAAKARGVPVRLISEPQQYRDVTRLWDAWNIDRMKMAGIDIKMRAHAGLNHQKLVLLYGQGLSIFGSSNWTSPSDNSQEEHNCFCTDPTMFGWFTTMFERKWNNSTGNVENSDFVPLPPGDPVYQSPANAASNLSGASVVLKWYGGPWAHKYDVLVGTDPNNLQPLLVDAELGPSQSSTQYQSFTATNLLAGTTYYWRVVSRTMANLSRNGDLWSFTTAGTAPPPPPNGTSGPGDIVLYGLDGLITGTKWSIVSDSSAAGGKRLWNQNAGAAKLTTALAAPASYVDVTFSANAGQAYHLWIRGRADGDVYTNDSAFVQFSNSVTAANAPAFRIGTTSAAEYNLEDCSGCRVAGWGWQDNGWGVMGPNIYFDTTGPQTLRIQPREDGLSIDQIILSPSTGNFYSTPPGALKNDITIYAATQGSMAGGVAPPPPPPTIPAPWLHTDIGTVGTAGGASFDGATTTFTVEGAGADIWGTADALHFAYQSLTGNGSIVARVASVSGTAAWVKAGVMIRSSLDANSAQAMMLVSRGKGLAFQRRGTTGGTSTSTSGTFAAAPYWVRLDRVGTTISAYQSTAGTSWTLVGSDTVTMGSTVYIGLGVSSHTTSAAATATFDNVSIIASTGAAPAPSSATLVREPYLQQVTATTAAIVWATAEPGPAELRFGRPGAPRMSLPAGSTLFTPAQTGMAADYYQHVARLTGLTPSTDYQYDILVSGVDLNAVVDAFRTAPATGTGNVSFVAFGDSGTGSIQQRQIASLIQNESFDLALHSGDLAYGAGTGLGPATFQTTNDWFFTPYRNWLRARPVFPVNGNHDSRAGNNNGAPYLGLFVLPANGATTTYPDHAERYYSFDYGPIHVVALDTEFAFLDPARQSAQLAWLEADLAATTQPWKIALFHRPPYSAGGEHGSQLDVRSALTPIFERYGVQLAIGGHEHDYERTVPLRAGSPDPTGVTYVVTGGGGAPLYRSGTATWTAASAARFHYVRGMVTACTLQLSAVGDDGIVFDSTSIARCTPAGDTVPPVVAITAPASAAIVRGVTGISVNATDNVGVTDTQFFVDGVPLGHDAVAPFGFNWDTTTGSNGAHVLTVSATDAASNTTTSAVVRVTVSNPTPGPGDVVLYAAEALPAGIVGRWQRETDLTAAGGVRLRNPNANAAKRTVALAAPIDYFEMTFTAPANVPYHLWMRGKADSDYYANDSVFVQFSDVTTNRIGTTAAAEVNLEDCSGCRVAGWGWQDNGYGANVLGPNVIFTTSGVHTIRIQVREDGLSIDQIMLSPEKFLTQPPGALKNDANVYPRTAGGAPPAPPVARSFGIQTPVPRSASRLLRRPWTTST